MGINPISGVFAAIAARLEKRRLVNEVSSVDSEGASSGKDDEARESSDFSEEQKAKAMLYGSDAKTHKINPNHPNHPNIDTYE